MCEKTEIKLVKFCNSGILCNWFVENYILPFILIHLDVQAIGNVTPHVMYCLSRLSTSQNSSKMLLDSFDHLFSTGYGSCNSYARKVARSEHRLKPIACLRYTYLQRKTILLMACEMSLLLIPENIWSLKYFDATLYSLNAGYDLMFGHISWDSELFAEYVRGITMTSKIVRCQYHIFPKPLTAERSQFLLVQAQDLMLSLNGSQSHPEFQLLSVVSKEFLRKILKCDDSQSSAIAPVAFVYLAALHFASSEYHLVINLCSSVLEGQTTGFEIETLNAGCLLFIDDIARIVGFCLLCKRFTENTHLKKRKIYLDLRLACTVFAYHLTVIATERMCKQLELTSNLSTSALPLDVCLLLITRRKLCSLIKSGIGLSEVRRCVYRRMDLLEMNLALSICPLNTKETLIEALMDFALENIASVYSVICEDFRIQYDIVDSYRALYNYKCCQYYDVLHLCERILHESDLRSDLKELGFANVLVLPPLDSFFDGDVQSLLGFHTLFYYLSPRNEDSAIAQFFTEFIHSSHEQLSLSLEHSYSIKCHYFIGRHFLARYLKLKCCVDCNLPFAEALAEFAAVNSNLPFELTIRQFILRKLHHDHKNSRVL